MPAIRAGGLVDVTRFANAVPLCQLVEIGPLVQDDAGRSRDLALAIRPDVKRASFDARGGKCMAVVQPIAPPR
jgi:hypothetical protein